MRVRMRVRARVRAPLTRVRVPAWVRGPVLAPAPVPVPVRRVARVRAVRAVVAAAAALPVLLALPGCSSSGSGCRPTRLEVRPVTVAGPHAAVTLTARLTSRGAPVAGQSVYFDVTTADRSGLPLGYVRTDTDGKAVYSQPGGLSPRLIDGQRATGYQARFDLQQKPSGKDAAAYCATTSTASFTCTPAAACRAG